MSILKVENLSYDYVTKAGLGHVQVNRYIYRIGQRRG